MFKNILVTGSSAVAGTAVKTLSCEYPNSRFIFATSRDCDLTDPSATLAYVRATKADGIIHLAAVSGGIGLSARHQASMLRDNSLITFSILEAARRLGVNKLAMALTAGADPTEAPLPFREESLHDGAPHHSNYGSSFAKRLIEPAIRAYREEYGLRVVGLVPNGIFGENDNFNFDDAPMLPALIRRFYENRSGNAPIEIWGDGSPVREYTYSHDVARAFLWALHHYDEAGILNSGTVEGHSIRTIALMIAEIMGINPDRLYFNTDKPNSVARRDTDNSRFVALSGFHYTPFRVGLERTVAWFIDAYENHRDRIRLYSKSRG